MRVMQFEFLFYRACAKLKEIENILKNLENNSTENSKQKNNRSEIEGCDSTSEAEKKKKKKNYTGANCHNIGGK